MLIQEGKFKLAIVNYQKIVDYLNYHDAKEDGTDEDKKVLKEWNELKLAAYNNLSLTCIKSGQYAKARNNCDEVTIFF